MKTCTRCGVEQSLDNFYKGKTYGSKDGYSYRCISCSKACVLAYENSGTRIRQRVPYLNTTRPSIYPGAIEVKMYGDNDLWTIMDIDDFKLYSDYKFYVVGGYASITPETRKLFIHRLIVDFEIVDHVNRNKLDNRKGNLRSATHNQNRANSRPQKRNRSGYKGVYLNNNGLYRAQITMKGKRIHIGYYATAVEAALAYDEAAKKYHGESAYLNFTDGVSND